MVIKNELNRSLYLKNQSYQFCCVDRNIVKSFIETYHYSKSINGCKVTKCFALYDDDWMVGAALFGSISTSAWKKYGEKEDDVIELRRLVTLDECPKNTESWFISKCLNFLKKEGKYKICVSYADPRYGHTGYIYQASNWNYEGQTAPDILLISSDGKEHHSRSLNIKYKGDYKPFAKKLRKMKEDGELVIIKTPGKHIYTYSLKGKHIWNGRQYPKKEL